MSNVNVFFVVSLECGGVSAENCTYMEMASTTSPTIKSCEYSICPMNSNIARIRFDFEVRIPSCLLQLEFKKNQHILLLEFPYHHTLCYNSHN